MLFVILYHLSDIEIASKFKAISLIATRTVKVKISFKLVLIFLFSLRVSASEIDSFTHHYQYQLEDSKELIHLKANQMLKQALLNANAENKGCHEKSLYKQIRKYFQNHMRGKLTPFIINSPKVSKLVINFKDSIYRDFKWYDAFSIIFIQTIYKNVAGPIIKMGAHYIGADKFEHIFGRGFKYFSLYYMKNKTLEEVLQYGHRSERIFLGANTTGVYSYADLAANFNGMRFWNDMLGKNPDILGNKFQIKPYITCTENNKWVQNNNINFLHYIDDSFDESINCSKFRNKRILNKVLKQINHLERKEGLKYTCPIALHQINDLQEKYQRIEHKILNFAGHDSL
jgi:hypothetical protein